MTFNDDQVTHNVSDPAIKLQSSCAGADKQQSKLRNNIKTVHEYKICTWKANAPNK